MNCIKDQKDKTPKDESLGLQEEPARSFYRDQSWVFIGGTDVEAETPKLWPPDVKS